MPTANHVTLHLNIDEVNEIIKALSKRPFEEVYELIGKIHTQSNNQLTSDTELQAASPA